MTAGLTREIGGQISGCGYGMMMSDAAAEGNSTTQSIGIVYESEIIRTLFTIDQ